MVKKDLTRIVIAIQDYKAYGYDNTVGTYRGMTISFNEDYTDFDSGYSSFIGNAFVKALGPDFSKRDMVLPAYSYENILTELENAFKEAVKTIRQVPLNRYADAETYVQELKSKAYPEDRNAKYDDLVEYFGDKYIINLRYDESGIIDSFYGFYKNLKEYLDNGHPLYISIATPEDREKYE